MQKTGSYTPIHEPQQADPAAAVFLWPRSAQPAAQASSHLREDIMGKRIMICAQDIWNRPGKLQQHLEKRGRPGELVGAMVENHDRQYL